MKYDFDRPINRRNTNSLKWNIGENELPMWVADMDFQTAPEIIETVKSRAEYGVCGYTDISEGWYNAYVNWWKKRHGFSMEREWLIFCTGVVPAISSVVRKLTSPAEKVIVQTPVYNIFFNSILNNGRQVVENVLKYDSVKYDIDFDDLEKKLSDPQTTLMILCNPHNPVGKIWDRQTLERIGELCYKYNVVVLSDEIHCDITDPGRAYVPFASVSDKCRQNSITCISPTKAFNMAGLQTAAVMIPNLHLRHKVWRCLNTDEVAEPNFFAIDAAICAFDKCEDWLDELRGYIFENKRIADDFIKNYIPSIRLVRSNATYLLWLDCFGLKGTSDEISSYIRESTGLYLSTGSQYGKGGERFLRMNIACPRCVLEDGLNRLKKGIDSYLSDKSRSDLK